VNWFVQDKTTSNLQVRRWHSGAANQDGVALSEQGLRESAWSVYHIRRSFVMMSQWVSVPGTLKRLRSCCLASGRVECLAKEEKPRTICPTCGEVTSCHLYIRNTVTQCSPSKSWTNCVGNIGQKHAVLPAQTWIHWGPGQAWTYCAAHPRLVLTLWPRPALSHVWPRLALTYLVPRCS
jgi:hypothetical protein